MDFDYRDNIVNRGFFCHNDNRDMMKCSHCPIPIPLMLCCLDYILGVGNIIDMAIHRNSLFANTVSILQAVVSRYLEENKISSLSGRNLVSPSFKCVCFFCKVNPCCTIQGCHTKVVKTADLQAHNASRCEALCACRSAVFTSFVRRSCMMKQGFALAKNLHI